MAQGSIVKRGEVYYIVYRFGGKQRWERVGLSRRDAEVVLVERMNLINKAAYREPKRISFADFADRWLEDYASVRVKPSTLVRYKRIVHCDLNPFFNQVELSQISAELVQAFVSGMLRQKHRTKNRRLSSKTILHDVVLLKSMLKRAVILGYIHENPAQYVERPKVEEKEMDFLTQKEIELFLNNATPRFRPLFTTAVMTGLRRGELLGLQWGDIDWNAGCIHVRRSMYKGMFITPKSSRSRRAVTMSPELARCLKIHKIACHPSKDDLVFCSEVGTPLDADNLIHREFLPALRRAGLRKIRFHDLRHTFTALLIATGENPKYIQQQLGHASIQTTMDRYGHLMPESHREAGERLDEFIFGEASTQRNAEATAQGKEAKNVIFPERSESSTDPTTGRCESFVSKVLAKRPKSCQSETPAQKRKSPKLVKPQGLTRW
jgi:integrase